MIIAPSILTADFCEIGKLIDESINAGINWIHLDIMDGNWVVNKTITFGPAVINSIRKRVGKEVMLDCHLMITNAEETWQQFANAGVDLIIVHIEAVKNNIRNWKYISSILNRWQIEGRTNGESTRYSKKSERESQLRRAQKFRDEFINKKS